MCVKCLHLGNVRLRSSFMKTWLPFWTALISVLCPVSCLLQFFFFFTEDHKKQHTHKKHLSTLRTRPPTVRNLFITFYIQTWNLPTEFDLFLEVCITGRTLTRSEMITSQRLLFVFVTRNKWLLLTCGFAVGLLTVWTVINVDIWSVIFIHPNTAETGKNRVLVISKCGTHSSAFIVVCFLTCFPLYHHSIVTVNLPQTDRKLALVS